MLKDSLKKILGNVGIGAVSSNRLAELLATETLATQVLKMISEGASLQGQSKAQLHQDVFVLLATGFKKGGYFVEFGATNGVKRSNTHLLEKHYGWNGILAEPAKLWHPELVKNRDCEIELNCVWHSSDETISFSAASDGELSTIARFADSHAGINGQPEAETYDVKTISLTDLLTKYAAPSTIEYLSIDTEGSEFEILNAFDFDRYQFGIIHVEHNYDEAKRADIFALLNKHGYTRRFENFSRWDDWFYNQGVLDRLAG
ncbi:MAG: FkbM family methyltransferase [Gammaproteobacteria bacterium]|nr:FkbM family methyltransferase [Gammaproteobacteria bacterium]